MHQAFQKGEASLRMAIDLPMGQVQQEHAGQLLPIGRVPQQDVSRLREPQHIRLFRRAGHHSEWPLFCCRARSGRGMQTGCLKLDGYCSEMSATCVTAVLLSTVQEGHADQLLVKLSGEHHGKGDI